MKVASDFHPTIARYVRELKRSHFRLTSVIRPGAPSHAAGNALDIAPMIYDPRGCSLAGARLLARRFLERGLPPVLVVAEGDHFHIQPSTRFRYGSSSPLPVVRPRALETGEPSFGQVVGRAFAADLGRHIDVRNRRGETPAAAIRRVTKSHA